MKYTITLKFFSDGETSPSDTEVLTIEAGSLKEARQLTPVFMRTRPNGRLIRQYDADGNELFGNH